MTMDTLPATLRPLARAVAVWLGLALGLLAAPAFAAPPETWEDPDNGSALEQLLVLVGIPLAVIALITLLVYLPSMVRGRSSSTALTFQEKPEWFGGPRKGVEAAQPEGATAATQAESGSTGGASGRW